MDIYKKALELAEAGRPFALGIVVRAQGSTPQKPGSKAILEVSGTFWGTLGGGMVEAEGLRRMRHALETGGVELFEFRLDEDYSRTAGPICGGYMHLFAHGRPRENLDTYRTAQDALRRRVRGVLVTHLVGGPHPPGRVQWVEENAINGKTSFPSSEDLLRALREERPWCVESGEGAHAFLEPIVAPPRLLVVGGGHVGQEVVRQAVRLGFEVTVVDDREEFARPELFPEGVTTRWGDIRTFVSAFPQEKDTFIVLVSKGHRPDAEALEGCIHGGAAYIGMIGSRRKIRLLRKHFIETGLATPDEFDRVAAPIGFDIGAITVPEIGVSIAAQLVAARRRGVPTARAMHEA